MVNVKNLKKEHLPLIVAVLLPVFLFTTVWIVNYLPSLLSKPQYDFVYFVPTSLPTGAITDFYTIEQSTGRIQKDPVRLSDSNQQYNNSVYRDPKPILFNVKSPTLYLHDTATNTSKSISFEEAQKLILDPSTKSPDGYSIDYANTTKFEFIFPSTEKDYSQRVLSKGGYNLPLNLINQGSDYYGSYYSFRMLGWTK